MKECWWLWYSRRPSYRWTLVPKLFGGSHRAPEECPQEVSRLIEQCMQQDSKKRPTAHEIITSLRDAMGMLPDTISGDLDLTPNSAGRTPFSRSQSGGRGRRLIGGLHFAQELEPIYGEDGGEEEAASSIRARDSVPQELIEESGGESEGATEAEDLEHAGSGYSHYVGEEPVDAGRTQFDAAAMKRVFNSRVFSRKWKSMGENRNLLTSVPSYQDAQKDDDLSS